ncbi:MarR family winged helix-turn-helix transcriptional regulator [Frondihabitans australicus]|uniref:MarR family transcriptional regulator n=1 Tax=Frondihabitans australicus TaxID=386892 RepID=A0A495IED2_9MICO|nr:MarR family transcriptional regulator [Frondihabitans australicus]RKR74364.1 MarR family transcriptional regulator [Frondihabitans australicus]
MANDGTGGSAGEVRGAGVSAGEPRWLSDAERAVWIRFAAVLELLPPALDQQLERDEGLSHFEYFVLAMLSEARERTLRMTSLATRTNATLPRLSRVVQRLEAQGLVRRSPCAEDRRATNATLTDAGWAKVVHAAPGHVENVRASVLDALSPAQVAALGEISALLLGRLDPDGRMFASQPGEDA